MWERQRPEQLKKGSTVSAELGRIAIDGFAERMGELVSMKDTDLLFILKYLLCCPLLVPQNASTLSIALAHSLVGFEHLPCIVVGMCTDDIQTIAEDSTFNCGMIFVFHVKTNLP